MTTQTRFLHIIIFAFAIFANGPAHAGGICTGPAGNESDSFYNGDYHTYQFCDGTNWMPYGGLGGNCTVSGAYSPTTPPRNGYFVLTSTTYNGNLGGWLGANASCLTELTTNTTWKGYSTANSNGQLVASKVFAFICDGFICSNLMPATTYAFAHVGSATDGGNTFTTDNSGIGPNDSADWSGANYFNGSYTYWTNEATTSNTAWGGYSNGQFSASCSEFVDGSSGSDTYVGQSANTTSARWLSSGQNCNNTFSLLCFVNP